MAKVYPSHVLTDMLREKNISCRLLWEIKGPKDTQIAWLSCYAIGTSSVVLVETFKDGGWMVLKSDLCNNLDDLAKIIED